MPLAFPLFLGDKEAAALRGGRGAGRSGAERSGAAAAPPPGKSCEPRLRLAPPGRSAGDAAHRRGKVSARPAWKTLSV